VGNLSSAFMNPETPMHLQFAYYESSLVVEFVIDRFGLNALKLILADLANGVEINAAIAKHAAKIEDIEQQFEAFARKRAEELAPDIEWAEPQPGEIISSEPNSLNDWLVGHPNSFWGLTVRSKRFMAGEKWEDAKAPLEKLISLYPQYAGEDNAYRFLAEVHRNLGETEAERETLGKLASISSDSIYAYDRLMQMEAEEENWGPVVAAGEKYLAVYPLNAATYWQMGRANQELGKNAEAVGSYRRLLLLDPADPADVNYRLASLLRGEDPATAKRHVLEALADAPRFRQAHSLLLEILDDASKADKPTVEKKSQSGQVEEDSE